MPQLTKLLFYSLSSILDKRYGHIDPRTTHQEAQCEKINVRLTAWQPRYHTNEINIKYFYLSVQVYKFYQPRYNWLLREQNSCFLRETGKKFVFKIALLSQRDTFIHKYINTQLYICVCAHIHTHIHTHLNWERL